MKPPHEPLGTERRSTIFFVFFVIGVFLLLIVSWWFSVGLQRTDPVKIYHIGILNGLDSFAPAVDGLKERMTDLGYIEGGNIVYDIAYTNFEPQKERATLERFVSEKVDLIIALPTDVAVTAKSVTQGTDIPVVFVDSFTEGTGLIDRIDRPGGNITGVRYPGPDIFVKNLEIIHQIAPQAKNIYLPYDPNYPATTPTLDKLRPSARSLGFTLVEAPVLSLDALRSDIDERLQMKDPEIDAILSMPSPTTYTSAGIAELRRLSLQRKLLLAGPTTDSVFGIHVDAVETGKQAALLTDKILHGAPAGNIPVVSSEMHLNINYRLAQELGYDIGEELLIQADKVIR